MAVKSKTKRFEVFKRDKFTCQYCGRRPPDVVLECDHIHPEAKGGDDEYSNLITACFDCNRGKRDRSGVESECDSVQEMQLETIAQLAAFNSMLRESHLANDEHFEWICQEVNSRIGITWTSDGFRKSLRVLSKKLPIEDLFESAELAGLKQIPASSQWKYFCKVCWNKIRDNKDREERDVSQEHDEDLHVKWCNENLESVKELSQQVAKVVQSFVAEKPRENITWQRLAAALCILSATSYGLSLTEDSRDVLDDIPDWRSIAGHNSFWKVRQEINRMYALNTSQRALHE